MTGRFIKGMAAGLMVGAAAGMMLLPEMDRGTKRKIKRTARVVKDVAGDAYDNMKGWTR